jgi:hypothetical protein
MPVALRPRPVETMGLTGTFSFGRQTKLTVLRGDHPGTKIASVVV